MCSCSAAARALRTSKSPLMPWRRSSRLPSELSSPDSVMGPLATPTEVASRNSWRKNYADSSPRDDVMGEVMSGENAHGVPHQGAARQGGREVPRDRGRPANSEQPGCLRHRDRSEGSCGLMAGKVFF